VDVSFLPELKQNSMEGIIRPGGVVPGKVIIELQPHNIADKHTGSNSYTGSCILTIQIN